MLRRTFTVTLCLGFALMICSGAALAQYQLKNLASNQVGKASHPDPLLANAWGLVHAPGSPWWLSDNASGWSTLYDGAGTPVTGLRVLIPTAGNGPDSGSGLNGPGTPTGIVYNATSAPNGAQEFQVKGGRPSFCSLRLTERSAGGHQLQTSIRQSWRRITRPTSRCIRGWRSRTGQKGTCCTRPTWRMARSTCSIPPLNS